MSVVQRLLYCTVAIPLRTPIGFATGDVSTRCFGLLKLVDSEGAVGIAFAYLGARPTGLVESALRELLAPVVVGREAQPVEALWRDMWRSTTLTGRAGVVARAIALVDIALWDLLARRNGVPLYRQLGGEAQTHVDAYASGGYYGPAKDDAALASEMAALRALGFRSVKIKTGKLPAHDEARRVSVARAALGDDIDLMLDANNAWPDLETAMSYLSPMLEARPFWIEEPFEEDDGELLAALAGRSGLRVATGENEANPLRFKEILGARAAQVIQPDATVCGGLTPWMRIARMAAPHAVMLCPHAYHNLHVHALAAAGTPGLLEYMPGDAVMNFGAVITEDLRYDAGRVALPTGPGLGFEFVEDDVSRYAAGPARDDPWVTLA